MKDCVLEWDFRSKAQLVGLMKNLMKRRRKMIQFDSIKYELPQAKANLTEVGDSL